jgi:glutamate N-acetyltransferase/amino-acid N-acetyltransferase
VEGQEVRIAALGKGSGMIHPQLVPHATMLVYILTDAAIEPALLQDYLNRSIEVSFNRISVDGDTSTNDTVLLLASGASGATIGPNNAAFRRRAHQVCTSLAHQVVADGEGITHVVELHIHGAATDADALKIAKAIAHSPLVKTAWAGNDPNWGRLVAAIGYSGAAIDPNRIDIRFGELPICLNGGRAPSSTKPPPTNTSSSPSSPSPSSSTRAPAPASSGPPTSPTNTSTSTPTTPPSI